MSGRITVRTIMTDGIGQTVKPRHSVADAATGRDQVTDAPKASAWSDAPRTLEAVIRAIPGIVFRRVMHPDGTLSYPFLSESAETYLGQAPDTLTTSQDGCLDIIHWADRETCLTRVRESARTGTPCVEEFRIVSQSGDVRWLSGVSHPSRHADGSVIWDGVVIDVTDRKRAEQWLEMVMDHAADVILTLDADGRIESSSAASETVFGYHPEALTGQPLSLILPTLDRPPIGDPTSGRQNTGGDPRPVSFTSSAAALGRESKEVLGLHRIGHDVPVEITLSEVLTEGKRFFVAVIRDIKNRKTTENTLQETQQRLSNIADNIPGLVFQRMLASDGALRFLYISGGTQTVLGHPPDAVMRDSELFLKAMSPDHRTRFLTALHHSAHALTPMEDDYQVTNTAGEQRWLRGWSRPIQGPDGTVIWEGVTMDVTERRDAEEHLLFLAFHDPLTGLGNRALFLERFKSLNLAESVPESVNTPANGYHGTSPSRRVALVSMGLDRFGIINATMGHAMGDRVLVAVAHRLQDALNQDDVLCRIGGDRFLVLLVDVPDDTVLEARLTRIRAQFGRSIEINGQMLDLSVSLGVSLSPDHGTSPEALIMHADAALHLSKDQGGGTSHTFTYEMGERANHIVTMRHKVRLALENREFVAYFQPQLDLRTGRIVGSEALARWRSPDDGLVPPGEFIPIAEEYGLIDEICVQVLEDACRWTSHWNTLGLGDISVAVNISGRQFHDARQLVDIVDHALSSLKLPPHLLELELTESSAMNDPENASRVMRLFEKRGVGCSIDDFGTGYSSLSVLKRFSLRKLKIDRTFVRDVTLEANDAAICTAIIAMAHAMNLKVCAEGVETRDQLQFLREQACDQVQGYLIARPLPPQDMETLLIRGLPDDLGLEPTPGNALSSSPAGPRS